jgi:hypothetical protein
MTEADRLYRLEPPWVEVRVLPSGEPFQPPPGPPPGLEVRWVDGDRCGTKAALLRELARALEFPPYFGGNWDALEECLADLEWLPASGYLVVITEAQRLLRRSAPEYATFIRVLEEVGRGWAAGGAAPARPARPFHVVLAVAAPHRRARRDWRAPLLPA